MLQHRVPPKGYSPWKLFQQGPFARAAVPARKPVPGVGSSSRAILSARSLLQHGLSRCCRWISAPSMGCLTMVFCRAANDSLLWFSYTSCSSTDLGVYRADSHIFLSLSSHKCYTVVFSILILSYLRGVTSFTDELSFGQGWACFGTSCVWLCPTQGHTLASFHAYGPPLQPQLPKPYQKWPNKLCH